MADSRQVQSPGSLGSGYQQAALVVTKGVQRLQQGGVAVRVMTGVLSPGGGSSMGQDEEVGLQYGSR